MTTLPEEKSLPEQLHTHGYYVSAAVKSEDWHAGVLMHFIDWHYVRYYPDGEWISCYRSQPFDFWQFTESLTPELLALAKRGKLRNTGDQNPLCWAGIYTINHGELIETFTPEFMAGKSRVTERFIRTYSVSFGDPSDALPDLIFVSR